MRANLILAAFVAIELAGAGALFYWRTGQPVPPSPDLERMDPLTAADLIRLREEACGRSTDAWKELAEAWLAWGYLAESEVAWQRLAELDPDSFAAVYGWAFSLERLGRVEEAIQRFEQAATLASPEMAPTCWYHIGRCWLRAENVSQAESAFERVANFPPAAFQLAKLQIRSGRIEEGLVQLNRIPEGARQSLQPLMLRMVAERDRGNEEVAAGYADQLERTVATFPVDDTAAFLTPIRLRYGLNHQVSLCDKLAADGLSSGTADCLGAALSKMDFWFARRLIPKVAELELKRGNADEALRLLEQQIEHSNIAPPILEMRGTALAMKGQHDAARQDWLRGAALGGTASTYALLAEEAARRGEADAEKRYGALALTEAGKSAFRENQLESAVGFLDQAVAIEPGNAQAWYYLGQCWQAIHQTMQARDAYERCLEAAPSHGRAADRLERISRQSS